MKRKIVLLVAVAAGIAAVLMTRVFISAKESELTARRTALERRYGTIEALCFSKDVPGGTPVSRGDLGLITVPALGLRGQAVTMDNLSDIVGRKTLLGHRRGDIVFWSDIEGGDPSVGGLSSDIKTKMRAMSISVTGAASVSGMVRPNDHVDVIGTFSFAKPGAQAASGDIVTCTILQNVLVLATGQTTAKNRGRVQQLGGSQGFSTVTLEVTPREAEMLAFTEQMRGRLTLTLRHRNDTTYEKELPKVDFEKIKGEIEELNLRRQQNLGGRR